LQDWFVKLHKLTRQQQNAQIKPQQQFNKNNNEATTNALLCLYTIEERANGKMSLQNEFVFIKRQKWRKNEPQNLIREKQTSTACK